MASEKMSLEEVLPVIRDNVVVGGEANAPAYVVSYVVKRSMRKIPTGPEDRKVLINKVTYTVLTPDHRNTITVDYFNPPTIDKMDHENVPIPDKEKLIPMCNPTGNDAKLSVIPVTATRYGWGFFAADDRFAGEDF